MMLKPWTHNRIISSETGTQLPKMSFVKARPHLPLMFAICCLSTLHLSLGLPQSVQNYMEGLDIPESKSLAFCFRQQIALPDQLQISSFLMDLCSLIYKRMKFKEENIQDTNKRFLFQYSRPQTPTIKTGENSATVARPFFLFRPRNGRKVSIDEH
ncbi:neuromedin-S-like [Xenopus laevis]|uniref:Neuromedin-S n=2 Tax=Xenopus laevis TaxID=8355 RepID=A0A1L8HGP6_XENLA|nr:neuromedin-S-like [Xenopus laevis]OCT95249.1 hypothetical protein XELAEV_18012934mg [Xenopus laevis]